MLRFFLIFLPGILVGCGGGGGGGSSAPVISNLQFSPSSIEAGGTIQTVSGSFDFENSDGDSLSLRFTASDGTDVTLPLSGSAGVTVGYIPVTGEVPTNYVGSFSFEVWLVDAAGNSSNSLAGHVTITANAGPLSVVATTGSFQSLNGVACSDPSATFHWVFTEKPSSSSSVISDSSSAVASFVPDVDGVYKAQLTVNECAVGSSSDVTTITSIPTGRYTLGSFKDDVSAIQGVPIAITSSTISLSDTNRWEYSANGLTYVDFSPTDGTVIRWQNYDGSLNTVIVPGNNVTSDVTFSIGSSQDDVARIQGTPIAISSSTISLSDTNRWEYSANGLTYVDFSPTDGTVIRWQNYDGNLKVGI